MRPAGEIRFAICETLRVFGAMPLVDLVERVPLQTTPRAIENTVKNAVRSGVLERVGVERREHCRHPVTLYDVAHDAPDIEPLDSCGIVVLADYLRGWA